MTRAENVEAMNAAALALAKFIDTFELVNQDGEPLVTDPGTRAHLEGTRAALLRQFREARFAAEMPHVMTGADGAAYPCSCEIGEDHEISNVLTVWTIYAAPADFPTVPFVVRGWLIHGTQSQPSGAMGFADTLDEARAFLPPGLVRFVPQHGDDPVIVESWM